jgi:hypothetical protein
MRPARRATMWRLDHPDHGTVPLLVVAVCACGLQVEPKIPRGDPPLSTSGYVGGVFSKDISESFGFRLRNEQSSESYVLEIDDEAVSLIAVRPGRYHVESWLTWRRDRGALLEQVIAGTDPLRDSFDVQAGQAILLGEWRADRHREHLSDPYTFTLLEVRITEPGAIRMLHEAYPHFVDVPVKCVHCIL